MEDIQLIMEEWKCNIDLHKFHDTLKQERIKIFLQIQTALIGVYGLLLVQTFSMSKFSLSIFFILLILLCIFAFIVTSLYQIMDKRAINYIRVVKTKLILLENQMSLIKNSPTISTYTEQYLLLNTVNDNSKKISAQYLNILKMLNSDVKWNDEIILTASSKESRFFELIKYFWVLCFVISLIIFIFRF